MLFSNSLSILPINVMFNGVEIERVSTFTFLGLHIDERLNWKYHIIKLCKLLSRNTGVIYKLKSVFPLNILRMLYATLILPYLHYGVLAWGNSFKS